MGSKKRRKKKAKMKEERSKYSSLADHKKVKSKLVTKMNQMNTPVTQYTWDKDLLPEHLWMAYLFLMYDDKRALELYDKFLNMIETITTHQLIGFVSEFDKIDKEHKKAIIDDYPELVVDAVVKPFGDILKLYPTSPMSWLISDTNLSEKDKEKIVADLNKFISTIFDGKNKKSGHIRTIPFRRVLKFGFIKFATDKIDDYLQLLPKYPNNLTKEEINQVHQLTRLQMSMFFNLIVFKDQKLEWPRNFWNQNVKLIKCSPFNYELIPNNKDQMENNEEKIDIFISKVENNVKIAKNYLDSLIRDFDFDVYDYIKDEVNLGLFSRITRLYVILLEYPNLWTKDLGGIILRCLVDTAITFSYLIRYGTANEYEEFIAYGEGKEKLLMLHIQDTYPEEKSLNNQGVEQIANNLGGGFTPELIDINLSFWTSISARDMAKKTNFEKYYRLIYDPTSADIHGTWFSLKSVNLTRCTLALHRYHRIPNYYEPLINIGYCNIGQEIYIQCIKNGIKYLNFPKDVKFKKLSL